VSISIVSISFDRVPSPKGAATHIVAFASALADAFGGIDLVTVGAASERAEEGPDFRALPASIRHTPLPVSGGNLIERVMAFRAGLRRFFDRRIEAGLRADVIHVRSHWEGYPIALRKAALCDRLVFEVNGLPSIELKYHYPAVADDAELMVKLVAQEDAVLAAADAIVTPSRVTADMLVNKRGVDPARVTVIPNGVDTSLFTYRAAPPPHPDRPLRLLYSGTMSAWQGVHRAVEALALINRDRPATLTLVGHARNRQRKAIMRSAERYDVHGSLDLRAAVTRRELAALHHGHDLVVAPLLANDRNLVQGCSPLKVLEAMATGTPLCASRMPVVQELAVDGRHALLARPGSAKQIKDAALRLDRHPMLGRRIAAAARTRVALRYQWRHAGAALVEVYGALLASRPSTRPSAARSSSG